MQPSVRIHRHGVEQQPVIVIDRFVEDPVQLIDDASMLGFRENGVHYPGVRATAPPRRVSALLAPVADLIADTFGVRRDLSRFEAYYSLVTRPPAQLTPIQRLPHFDGVEAGRIAVLLFLSRDETTGTAFYHHRATGFESLSPARFGRFSEALRQDLARHGAPGPGYISGDTPLYRQIARYDGRFNRALIYRGSTLHCADLPDGMSFSADPAVGRLTLNVFVTADPL